MPLDVVLLAEILPRDVVFTMQNLRPRALMTALFVRKNISWEILKKSAHAKQIENRSESPAWYVLKTMTQLM